MIRIQKWLKPIPSSTTQMSKCYYIKHVRALKSESRPNMEQGGPSRAWIFFLLVLSSQVGKTLYETGETLCRKENSKPITWHWNKFFSRTIRVAAIITLLDFFLLLLWQIELGFSSLWEFCNTSYRLFLFDFLFWFYPYFFI